MIIRNSVRPGRDVLNEIMIRLPNAEEIREVFGSFAYTNG